jgi:hypothetical protein
MAIGPMLGWKDACKNRLLPDLIHQSVSMRTSGWALSRLVPDSHCGVTLSIRHEHDFRVEAVGLGNARE